MKTIGVLTSGGDAPGMNAAVRAVVRTARYYGMKVKGIRRGYKGLIYGDIFEMETGDVSNTLQRGGTFLLTARSAEFKEKDVVEQAVKTAKYFGIEGIVVIGGDGSFRGAKDLAEQGMPVIGIPGTIDNDIPYTEYTIGFDTAVNTAMEAIDKIRDTTSSHERCNIIQVMGRNSGAIALSAGIATGAEAILVPEIPYDFEEDILRSINLGKVRNKTHFIIVVAEGVGGCEELATKIQEVAGIETKLNTLGYLQRGGSPTAQDRVTASKMGSRAVELLREGKTNRIIGIKNNDMYDIDITEGLEIKNNEPSDLARLAKIISI
ncbi:MAG: 6-phosphofructokinase [Eubacteriales bacterium]|nr:6-phosphofructokinase [Eubacteriales bacterium]